MNQGKKQTQVQPSKKKEESLSYTVEVRDKEGRVIQRISAPSRSYVEQWNQIVNVQARQDTDGEVRDHEGVLWNSVDRHQNSLKADGGIGTWNMGLAVGTGSTAVVIDDYILDGLCLEGTGVDQLEYQANVFTAPAVVGPTCSFAIRRIMINNSGDTIIIRELGCMVVFSDVGNKFGLAWRDVLPGDVPLPNGGSITVTYTLAVTV